jgi:hypothetical protein
LEDLDNPAEVLVVVALVDFGVVVSSVFFHHACSVSFSGMRLGEIAFPSIAMLALKLRSASLSHCSSSEASYWIN